MSKQKKDIAFNNQDYAAQKITVLVMWTATIIFLVLNFLDIFKGDKTAIPFLTERILMMISIGTYYLKLRRCEKKREVLADSAVFIISTPWIILESTSRLLEIHYFGHSSLLSERLILIIILIGASMLNFNSRKFLLIFVTHLFVCFFLLEILTSSPPMFLWALLVGYVYALIFALKKHDNIRIFEITIKSYFNSLWKVRKAEEEIEDVRDKCLHLGNIADAMNSPILVVTNCVGKLKKEAMNQDKTELIEKISSIEQKMLQVREFSTWLSIQRDQNATLKQSSKIIFEMTKLLKESEQS